MTGSQAPSTALLLDWLEDRLSAKEGSDLVRSIGTDPALQAQVDWLRGFLQLSSVVVLADPPQEVRQAATAAFAAYAQASRPPNILQRLSAALTSDSWQRLSMAGVRNVALRGAPRQLIYSSELADVALNILVQASGQQLDLDGQIFPLNDSDPAGFVVQLLQDDVELRLTTCDAAGKFSLAGLPVGDYDLIISGDQAEIELGPIELA